ncbi:radical SAM family heme chaperone HemW [[Clostridium] innocuum]|nr:radical SAM family heme chaperone HemW [[Clostridium] innocuum]
MKAVYVHVPFCRDICAYCDFTRCRYHAGLADQWLIAVEQELQKKLANVSVETAYIGGGTPSALNSRQLEMLLKLLSPYTAHVQEYTIEANVESLEDDKIELLKRYGVNRISLGVQTLQPTLLSIIGRRHTREEVGERIQQLHRYGVHNISIDLIYGLPQQTMQMWKEDLQDIIQHFQISHISLYALTIEEHSQFGRDGVQNIDADVEVDMDLYAVSYLEKHGFSQYEISNFAKPGAASVHNQMYWNYEDFCGIGCGASGKSGHVRYDNTRNLHTYLQKGSCPDIIELSRQDEMFEMLMMSLRMKQGMSLSRFRERFAADFETIYRAALQKNIARGMLLVKDGYVRTTGEGMLLLHDVLVDFLSEETL